MALPPFLQIQKQRKNIAFIQNTSTFCDKHPHTHHPIIHMQNKISFFQYQMLLKDGSSRTEMTIFFGKQNFVLLESDKQQRLF